ncbi:hypothetical protein EYZ11_002243 [Aspergillus tanneri]|uniref:FAD-binding PCMH-type domain-containing protein n=1 Tax=Aspergillus tanneri TaxID=1220188 RepID=A0A4S3JU46_9EURO|nr:hypothetical protein EYZ11_002243 [Aspergillus tanneri]
MGAVSRRDFSILFEKLPKASILLRDSWAYEEAVFVGNLLYRMKSPAAVVQAINEEDVRVTVEFAKAHNLPLSVKSGGHSNAAYCLNQDGIVLDMRSMNKVKVDKDAMEITIGGGAQWKHVYHELYNKDPSLIVVGGQCPTVGASAFTMGGGLSPFSRCYGLGIDNLVEVTLITANGVSVTVTNNEDNPDKSKLFWALRGGGGGNFGIVTKLKTKLHHLREPDGTVVCGNLSWEIPVEEESFNKMMDVWNKGHWPEEVCADAVWRYKQNQLYAEMTIIYNGRKEACDRDLAPILKYVENKNNTLKPMKWWNWVVEDIAFSVRSKLYHHHASFIFPEHGITSDVTSLMTKWMQRTEKKQTTKIFELIEEAKDKLRPFSVQGKAGYINYIDNKLENWQEAYYGANYQKLRCIKSHWDPTNFFHFDQSIEPVDYCHSQPDWESWEKYAVPTPTLLGDAEAADDIYAANARIRSDMLSHQ